MNHVLPPLPYAKEALEPVLSKETLSFHHDKHHQAYVDNLNKLIPGTEFESLALLDVVLKAPSGPILNNAAQVWNHTFYFEALTSPGKSPEKPSSKITDQWGSFEALKQAFNQSALGLFGSGWTWLVMEPGGHLQIVNESNAGNPLRKGLRRLLCVVVWEHAYYLDYQNRRAEYLEKIWDIINWKVVNARIK